MKPTRKLTPEQSFFFRHAGYSYNKETETPARGRTRCAVALAAAEADYLKAHQEARVCIEWRDDPDGWADFHSDKRAGTRDDSPQTIETAFLIAADGRVITSLGGIEDATEDYRRVIRAELASECGEELAAIINNR